jgi:hypothetical protein
MTLSQKTLAATAALALVLPGAAIAAPSAGSGKAGAPGQVCKASHVKGKKMAEQKAARKTCIKDAVAQRKAAKAPAETAPPAESTAPPVESTTPPAESTTPPAAA